FDDGLGLFVHELQQIVWSSNSFARRSTSLPAAKRLRARPGAGCCAAFSVCICDAEVYVLEEPVNFALVVAEYSRSQTKVRVVCLLQRFVQALDFVDDDERQEEFFFQETVV